MPGLCLGNCEDTCCYINHYGGSTNRCPYVEENTVEGRRWACGLLRKYGSWDAAIASEEYQTTVQPYYDEFEPPGYTCATWPPPGKRCSLCGLVGE